ncbi:MAG: AAA family ATPase [Thermoplasmata archaeon]|nr:AAA family ATPase [Thermoplasmata archaeon]
MTADPGDGRPFVGRVEAVEALQRRFEDARAGHGGVTLLVGETGVGKTELLAKLVRKIRERDVRVLEARAAPLDAPPPFALIRAAIESARNAGVAPAPDEAGRVPEAFLIGFAPRLDDGAFSTPVQIEDRLLEALDSADEHGAAGRLSLLNGIAAQFLEFTRRGPTVVILEDLHRADETSLAALEFLAGQFQNRPLWVLATIRPPPSLPESRRNRIETFETTTHSERIPLRPLNSAEVAEYLFLRDPNRVFSGEEVARRFSESGGNPLLLEQLERRLEGSGRPVPSAERGPSGEPLLPPLDELGERVAAAGAVLGPEFSFQLLLRASGEDEESLAETVDRLVGAGVFLERPGENLAFADERIRAGVYDSLNESRRRLLHRRVGEALEASGSADLPTIYALARHYHLGKVDEKSISYNRTAAEVALRADAPEVAVEHLGRALESHRRLKPDDWEAETDLVIELAQQVDRVGRLEEAESMLRQHLARRNLKTRVSPAIYALTELYLAKILTDRGEWHEAERTLRRMAEPASVQQLERHPTVLMAMHRLLGEALYYAGRYPEALAEHTEELRLADATGNARARALGEVRRANVLGMMGEHESAITDARNAAKTLEALGDASEAAFAHLFVGVVISGLPAASPRYAESIAEFAEAMRLGEKARDPRRVAWALFNTADILREMGQLTEAAEQNARSREILERIGDRFGLVNAMIVQGKILTDRGEYERAEVELLDAYRIVRELKAPADEVDVVLRLAQLSYARGDRASARRRVVELERNALPTLRPDLAVDFERLKSAVAAKEKADGASK